MWLWRPVLRDPPLCAAEDISNGRYTINDFANFNEAMDVEDEIARRLRPKDTGPEED